MLWRISMPNPFARFVRAYQRSAAKRQELHSEINNPLFASNGTNTPNKLSLGDVGRYSTNTVALADHDTMAMSVVDRTAASSSAATGSGSGSGDAASMSTL